jgi:hypothetical protein
VNINPNDETRVDIPVFGQASLENPVPSLIEPTFQPGVPAVPANPREYRLQYQELASAVVHDYVSYHLNKSDNRPDFEIYVVWWAKTLQNWKCLLSTTLPDGMYYEVTYNGDKDELYLDAYKKWNNVVYDGTALNDYQR